MSTDVRSRLDELIELCLDETTEAYEGALRDILCLGTPQHQVFLKVAATEQDKMILYDSYTWSEQHGSRILLGEVWTRYTSRFTQAATVVLFKTHDYNESYNEASSPNHTSTLPRKLFKLASEYTTQYGHIQRSTQIRLFVALVQFIHFEHHEHELELAIKTLIALHIVKKVKFLNRDEQISAEARSCRAFDDLVWLAREAIEILGLGSDPKAALQLPSTSHHFWQSRHLERHFDSQVFQLWLNARTHNKIDANIWKHHRGAAETMHLWRDQFLETSTWTMPSRADPKLVPLSRLFAYSATPVSGSYCDPVAAADIFVQAVIAASHSKLSTQANDSPSEIRFPSFFLTADLLESVGNPNRHQRLEEHSKQEQWKFLIRKTPFTKLEIQAKCQTLILAYLCINLFVFYLHNDTSLVQAYSRKFRMISHFMESGCPIVMTPSSQW
ncbi:hypothetical protein OIO90_004310 [Microbotryomycetes sp. JL221]|nr:hypothetical protein OIO90_004310 [Microbotryomycetes sp. JL221]